MPHGTLKAPNERPSHIPKQAQWLGGIGAGAYFHIEKANDSVYMISRWDKEGNLDCERKMTLQQAQTLDLNTAYQFEYPCHCAEVNIIQEHKHFRFLWEGNIIPE